MSRFQSKLLQELDKRGFIKDCTSDVLDKKIADGEKITLYSGFDLTAKSLHIGNLVQIMILRTFQKYGHNVIALIGGGTSKIGDPSFRSSTRQEIDHTEMLDNKKGIKDSLLQFLDSRSVTFVDNDHWLSSLNYISFLNDVGRYFTVNRMTSLDSVKTRLSSENGMTFTEFNYSLLQAYDFYVLNEAHNCTLQVGGSDQWGNIVSGIDYVRKRAGKEVFGLTTNLIETAGGKKMSKSAGTAVWVRKTELSPFEYFQFFRNVDDLDVVRFMKLFTEVDLDAIPENISGKDFNALKEKLAFEATKICHGEEAAQNALDKAREFFESRKASDAIEFEEGERLTEVILRAKFATTKSEAKRLIEQGSVSVGDNVVSDIVTTLSSVHNDSILVVGKKKFIKLVIKK